MNHKRTDKIVPAICLKKHGDDLCISNITWVEGAKSVHKEPIVDCFPAEIIGEEVKEEEVEEEEVEEEEVEEEEVEEEKVEEEEVEEEKVEEEEVEEEEVEEEEEHAKYAESLESPCNDCKEKVECSDVGSAACVIATSKRKDTYPNQSKLPDPTLSHARLHAIKADSNGMDHKRRYKIVPAIFLKKHDGDSCISDITWVE
eukprot:14973283-Ditylum_brightwellii.AAC.1